MRHWRKILAFSIIISLSTFHLQVEYKDYSLGQTRFALAETPNEALPLNCRPNFGAAWLTKDKFKVGIAKLQASLIGYILSQISFSPWSLSYSFLLILLQVNKTYDYWYTSGISKVSLYRDDLFSCQAKDPSQVEMIKRYFILWVFFFTFKWKK